MRELLAKKEDKNESLKEFVTRLQEGTNPEELTKILEDLIAIIPSAEITQIEEDLVKNGIPREVIGKLRAAYPTLPEEQLRMEEYELHCCGG